MNRFHRAAVLAALLLAGCAFSGRDAAPATEPEPEPATKPAPPPPLASAEALLARGDTEAALAAFEAAAGTPRLVAPASVGASRAAARLGRTDDAFQHLAAAVAAGWGDRAVLANDPDLALLAKDERYGAVLPPLLEGSDAFAEDVRVLHEWRGEGAGDQYGWVTRRVGDLDGDGVCDFTSTAPSANGWRGRVYVISSRTGEELFRAEGGAVRARLGDSVAGEFDANGDGTMDVIAGAPGLGQMAGRALVLSGADGAVLHDVSEGAPGDAFGMKVAGLADLDGDGCDEFAVGASGIGPGHVTVHSGRTAAPLFTVTGESDGDTFGQSLDGTRGDGPALMAVGAPAAGPRGTGRVYTYELDAEGATPQTVIDADPDTGAALGTYFVTYFGDADGDGVSDLYASDFSDAARGPNTGRVFVHSGATGERMFELEGHVAGEGFGTTAAVSGDANGDGAADLVIGAWQHSGVAPSAGKCYLHSGADGALLAEWSCAQALDTLGFDAIGVGDADGDGAADFVLSSAWSVVEHGRQGRVFLVAGPELEP